MASGHTLLHNIEAELDTLVDTHGLQAIDTRHVRRNIPGDTPNIRLEWHDPPLHKNLLIILEDTSKLSYTAECNAWYDVHPYRVGEGMDMPPDIDTLPETNEDEDIRFWTHVPFDTKFNTLAAVHDTLFERADAISFDDLDKVGTVVRS